MLTLGLVCAKISAGAGYAIRLRGRDRKSTRLNSSHSQISYAVFCLKKKKKLLERQRTRVNSRSTQMSYAASSLTKKPNRKHTTRGVTRHTSRRGRRSSVAVARTASRAL